MSNPGLLLQIEGLLGDCRHPQYFGWMDLLWFSFGGAGEFGQNRPTHLATLTMPVGRISTTLQIASLRNGRFKAATLVALNPTRTGERFRAVMEDVRVGGFQFQGYSGDRPIHSLELRFFNMEVQHSAEILEKLRHEREEVARSRKVRVRSRPKPSRATRR